MVYLMHKNIPVATVSANKRNIAKIINKRELPVGIYSDYPQIMDKLYLSWIKMRCIPNERQNIYSIERKIGCSVSDAFVKSLGVSLTDCYWYKEENSSLNWEDVNFYDNGFSEGIADISIFEQENEVIDFDCPDITTDGMLKKGWKQINGIPTLLKFGDIDNSGVQLLSANEVAAYYIASLMGIPAVEYAPIRVGKDIICACPCFVADNNTEYVTALQITHSDAKYHGKMLPFFFEQYGMENDFTKMLLLDALLYNTDRHEKNFGYLRKADTKEIIGFTPIYDTGNCLGWRDGNFLLKPLSFTREQQIKYVASKEKIYLPEKEKIRETLNAVYETFSIPESYLSKAYSVIDQGLSVYKNICREREMEEFVR